MLSHLLAGVWFILWGLNAADVVAVSGTFLGVWAIITGGVYLLEQFVTVPTLPVRRP